MYDAKLLPIVKEEATRRQFLRTNTCFQAAPQGSESSLGLISHQGPVMKGSEGCTRLQGRAEENSLEHAGRISRKSPRGCDLM